MKSEKKNILILTANPEKHGNGHITRMKILQNALKLKNVKSKIKIWENQEIKDFNNYKIVILDNRDSHFPENILLKKNIIKIAVDNRGIGRKQADYIRDILPHFKMKNNEIRESLKNIILPDYFINVKNQILEAQLFHVKTFLNGKKNQNIENKQFVSIKINQEKRLSPKKFQQLLKNSSIVCCYFGQTLFEALYLGKKICLHDISEYHAKLSDWFCNFWQKAEDDKKLLDGLGTERFVNFITSLL
ncbi:MAG: hypothetical protein OEZ22_00635 [Spirochaetia bacterium]|nr:hypothetical protein [Spirochaetia bacterium]